MMAEVIPLDNMRYGASPDDWCHFDLILGITEDLLPVVSNPRAEISPDSKMAAVGKTPSIYNNARKVAGLPNWTQRRSTAADIDRWAKERDYGICIQTRRVRALDIDIDDAAAARAVHDAVLRLAPALARTVRTRPNAAKLLLAFELPGDFTKRKFRTEHGIVEFLATGQQFIAVGTHPSGARYEWPHGLPDAFPVLTAEEFEALWQALVDAFAVEPASESAASIKHEKLVGAIADDPVAQHLADRGMVKRTERDGRLHIVCPFEHEHTSESGDSATTYWPAHTGGYAKGHFHCLHAHCEHRTDDDFKGAIGYADQEILHEFENLALPVPPAASPVEFDMVDGGEVDRPVEPPAASPPREKFTVIPAHEFIAGAPPTWLVKGVIPKAELVVVFGESGSGKSFITLDIAAHIAQGAPWRERKTKPGRIAYVAAEAAGGFMLRLKAYADMHQLDWSTLPFGIIYDAPNLMEKADALAVAKKVIEWGRADVVIIDTLAQTMPGGNENAGEDMGKVLAHCKGIHRATGATVILIHHAGKDTTKGARGWSGLRAAADAEVEVVRTDQARYIRTSKQKDGEDGLEWGFALDVVQVGVDEDGDAITSCVAVPADLPSARSLRRKLGPWEKIVAEVVGEIGLAQSEGIEIAAVIAEAAKRMPEPEKGKRDTRKQHAKRALIGLCAGDDAPYLLEDDCIAIL